jgi:hypothetical protein
MRPELRERFVEVLAAAQGQLYARYCESCGTIETSADPWLLWADLRCPVCEPDADDLTDYAGEG